MKCSVAVLSTFAVVALAQPKFTNSNFAVEEGQPFVLTFTGCESGCDIILQDGDQSNLNNVKTLATGVKGDSATVTLEGLPSGDYNFKIVDKSGDSNYSQQFPMQGGGSAPSPSASGSASTPASASASASGSASASNSKTGSATGSSTFSTKVTASGSKTTSEATGTSSKPTSSATKSNTASGSSTGTSSSATSSGTATKKAPTSSAPPTTTAPPTSTKSVFERPTSTSTKAAVTTTPPGSGAGQVSSPMVLVAGVAMAVAYLS